MVYGPRIGIQRLKLEEKTMIIGVIREIKEGETRVALTPDGVSSLIRQGHSVLVDKGAGLASGFTDRQFRDAGATILPTAAVWKKSEMVVKVKEPLPQEFQHFRENLILFTYLHLASVPPLARALCQKKVIAVGYETVKLEDDSLPLLTPMSEVAGRVATQIGTHLLHRRGKEGRGLLLGGVTGTGRGDVVVIGGGIVGINAADVAVGLRANVTILDIDKKKVAQLKERYGERANVVLSTPESATKYVENCDLLVGAVLVMGDKAPKVVTKKMVQQMRPGSVIVDVAIDQGGCIETSKLTSHTKPTFVKYGIIHYCVPNMPALAPETSTAALTTATFSYILQVANHGVEKACQANSALALGLQVDKGKVVHPVIKKLFKSLA